MHDRRGRLTVPDVLFATVSIAVLASLLPVMYSLIDGVALGPGVSFLAQLLAPIAVLVLLAGIWRKSVQGVGR